MTSNPYSTPMIARDSSLSNRSSKPSAIYHAYTLLIAHCVRLWSTVCCLILSICFPKRQQVLFGNNRLLIEYLGQFSTVVVAFHRSGSNYQFQILYLIGSGLIRVIHFYWSLFLAFLMEEEDGGYDADFVDNLDKDLECPVCMLALREPVLTHCGHHFCHSCTMKLMKSSSLALYACSKQTRFRFGKFDCPLDSQTCKEGDVSSCSELVEVGTLAYLQIFRDRKVERKVLSLMVYCSRRALGCSWKGELRNLQVIQHVVSKKEVKNFFLFLWYRVMLEKMEIALLSN